MASRNFNALRTSGEKILMEISKERNNNSRDNREGLKGWLNPSRYGWERVSYWLQRLTGVFLLVYFIGHVYETSSLTRGLDAWNALLQLTQTPWGHLFLILVIGTSDLSFVKRDQIDIYTCW